MGLTFGISVDLHRQQSRINELSKLRETHLEDEKVQRYEPAPQRCLQHGPMPTAGFVHGLLLLLLINHPSIKNSFN